MSRIQLNIKPESFNDIYLHTVKYNKSELYEVIEKVYYGGSGGGKSEAIVRLDVLKDWLSIQGNNGVVIMEHSTVVRKVAFPLIKKVLRQWLGSKWEDQITCRDREMHFINKTNGNEIICLGSENPDDLKGITFMNGILTFSWVEEADNVSEEIQDTLEQRMRGTLPKGVQFRRIYSYNPTEEDKWCYKNYIPGIRLKTNYREEGPKAYFGDRYQLYDRILPLTRDDGTVEEYKIPVMVLKTTCEDNKFVGNIYRATLRNQKPHKREIYYYGNAGVKEDPQNIVPFEMARSCTENKLLIEPGSTLGIGADPSGDGPDKMVFKARYGNNELELLPDEKEFDSTSTTDFARHIAELGKRLEKRIIKEYGEEPSIIVCNIDKTGVGKGTFDTLEDIQSCGDLQNWVINGVNFGSTECDDIYKNVACAMYFNVRELVMNRDIYLVDCSKTLTQLCTRHYFSTTSKEGTKYFIEPKDKYKKRRKCGSPDYADATVLAFWEPHDAGASFLPRGEIISA